MQLVWWVEETDLANGLTAVGQARVSRPAGAAPTSGPSVPVRRIVPVVPVGRWVRGGAPRAAIDTGDRSGDVRGGAGVDAAGRAGGVRMTDVATELAGLSGVARRLLALHVPAENGRCRACTTPGTGLPGAAWPCVLHFYATAANEMHRRRRIEWESQ